MKKVNDIIDQINTLTPLEIKELVESLGSSWNISTSLPVGAPPSPQLEESSKDEPEKKDTFSVVLKSVGSSKISLIKVAKDILNKSLLDTSKALNSLPLELAKGISEEDAQNMKESLQKASPDCVVEFE